MGELPDAQARLIDQATAAAGSASLSDIQHVVILMQENRSFDHYFGTLSGVRGFSDPNIGSQFIGGQAHPRARCRTSSPSTTRFRSPGSNWSAAA
jgi:phospholipase C